jgi:hypothetical protein
MSPDLGIVVASQAATDCDAPAENNWFKHGNSDPCHISYAPLASDFHPSNPRLPSDYGSYFLFHLLRFTFR